MGRWCVGGLQFPEPLCRWCVSGAQLVRRLLTISRTVRSQCVGVAQVVRRWCVGGASVAYKFHNRGPRLDDRMWVNVGDHIKSGFSIHPSATVCSPLSRAISELTKPTEIVFRSPTSQTCGSRCLTETVRDFTINDPDRGSADMRIAMSSRYSTRCYN